MAGRATLVASAYVALGLAGSGGLLLALDTANEPATTRDALVVGTFFVAGTIGSIATGAVLSRAWAPLLPIAFVVAALPAGDVVYELPLWALLLACAPFAAAAVWLGSVARRFVAAPNVTDGVLATLALWLVACPYALAAGLAYGWDPWEARTPEGTAEVQLTTFCALVVLGWSSLLVGVLIRRGRTAPVGFGERTPD